MEQEQVETPTSVNNSPIIIPSQNMPLPVHQSSPKKYLIIVGVIIGFLLFGVGGFVLGTQKTNQPSLSSNMPNLIDSPTTPFEPTSTTQLTDPPTIDSTPIPNGLYMGTYQGQEALFLTNSKLSEYLDSGVRKTSPDVGVLEQLDGIGREPFRYNELSNPIRIASFDVSTDVLGISNFKRNTNKSKLYVVIDIQKQGTKYPDITQELYQVDLLNYSQKLVWSHNIGSDKYPKAGPSGIDVVESDKYVILWLGICYACEGFDPHGSVLLNLQTGAEKYLGEVGDFQFNLINSTLSYKNLIPTEAACEPSPGCNDGKKTIYKPSGEIFTIQLP